MRILLPIAIVWTLWIALPVRLPSPSAEPPSTECLTLPDAPPDRPRPDLIPALERCSALHPTDVELMADLGAQYESAAQFTRAEMVYQRALAIDPGYADLRLRLGRLLFRRGDASGARREAAAALAVQPNRRALLDLLQAANAAPKAWP